MVASLPVTTPAEEKISKPVDSKDSSSKQNKPVSKVDLNAGVEEAVREYFADIPLMIEIAKAESQFRQFGKDGKPLQGVAVNEDTGVFQINKTYHLARSQKLGYDINTLAGNMAYARRLYQEQGAWPWISSWPMWGKSPFAANYKPKSRTSVIAINKKVDTTNISGTKTDSTVLGTPVSGLTSVSNSESSTNSETGLVAGEEITSPVVSSVKELPTISSTKQEVLSE